MTLSSRPGDNASAKLKHPLYRLDSLACNVRVDIDGGPFVFEGVVDLKQGVHLHVVVRSKEELRSLMVRKLRCI